MDTFFLFMMTVPTPDAYWNSESHPSNAAESDLQDIYYLTQCHSCPAIHLVISLCSISCSPQSIFFFPLLAFFLPSFLSIPSSLPPSFPFSASFFPLYCFSFLSSLLSSLQIMISTLHYHREDWTQLPGVPLTLNLLWYSLVHLMPYNNKNEKSDIWQQLSVEYSFFCCVVVWLTLVWVIFASVIWLYLS